MKKKKKPKQEDVTEDWHKEIYTEDPDNAPKRFKKPPKKYEQNFLAKMDSRTIVFKELKTTFDEVIADLGGKDNLSHVQHCLVERFTFLEFIIRDLEQRISQNPGKNEELLGKWVMALNCLTGLSKTIGLKRHARKIDSLESYVRTKKNGK